MNREGMPTSWVQRVPTMRRVHDAGTPSSSAVHVDGRGMPCAPVSLNPKDTERPAATVPFQDAFRTLNVLLLTLPTPFHGAEIVPSTARVFMAPIG